jgi:acylphosphatase
MKKQIHVYYSGRVQGVGFRFTAEDIARDLGVTGWVKNLRDGRVEVVAEAEEDALKDFLERVSKYFARYIQDVDIEWSAAKGELKDFGIQF